MQDLEIRLLLQAIYERYHYDFRHYAMASLRRRLQQAATHFHCGSLAELLPKILQDGAKFSQLLRYLTVQVSEMFRDPQYFAVLRTRVLPLLATYPSIKVWVAGCGEGEEAYSLAVLLHEERLLERSIVYATDINQESLRRAQAGVYSVEQMRKFTENHRLSGARISLSDFYHASRGHAVIDSALREKITFADHSLATDGVFSEVQLISCRNVLIYFDRQLQDHAVRLFSEALCHRGFLGLGMKESLRFSAHADEFEAYDANTKIYRKAA
jgi:chemotaxis protein methyltransferase CheR